MRHTSSTQETNESGADSGLRVADNPSEILKSYKMATRNGLPALFASVDRRLWIHRGVNSAFTRPFYKSGPPPLCMRRPIPLLLPPFLVTAIARLPAFAI